MRLAILLASFIIFTVWWLALADWYEDAILPQYAHISHFFASAGMTGATMLFIGLVWTIAGWMTEPLCGRPALKLHEPEGTWADELPPPTADNSQALCDAYNAANFDTGA